MNPTDTSNFQHTTRIIFSILLSATILHFITHHSDNIGFILIVLAGWSTTRVLTDGIQSFSHLLQKFHSDTNSNPPNPPPH